MTSTYTTKVHITGETLHLFMDELEQVCGFSRKSNHSHKQESLERLLLSFVINANELLVETPHLLHVYTLLGYKKHVRKHKPLYK